MDSGIFFKQYRQLLKVLSDSDLLSEFEKVCEQYATCPNFQKTEYEMLKRAIKKEFRDRKK